jgi:hypothetical protein
LKDIGKNRISRKRFLKLLVSGFFILFLVFIPGFGGAIRQIFPIFNRTLPRAKSNVIETTSETDLEAEGKISRPPIFNPDGSVTYPIKFKDGDTRALLEVEMQVKDGSWKYAVFNLDTGASWPTDIPLQLLGAFGLKPAPTDNRPTKNIKCRIPGFIEFNIPCMLQDKAHYDLFKTQQSRYPLLRVRDLMPFVSIVYHKDRIIFRTKDKGPPPEINTPGTIRLPDASPRSNTPTSSWYWFMGKMMPPSGSGSGVADWFQITTGDLKIIIKKSLSDKVGLNLTPGIDPDNFYSNATIEFSEARPVGSIKNIKINVRKDSARFARGGEPRNILGGLGVLNSWSVIVWDLHMALVPANASSANLAEL